MRALVVTSCFLVACGSSQKTGENHDTSNLSDTDAKAKERDGTHSSNPDEFADKCEKAAAHVLSLQRQDLEKMIEGLSEEKANTLREQLYKELDENALLEGCKEKRFTHAQLDCIMTARSIDELMIGCGNRSAPADELERCSRVADRVSPILKKEMEEILAQMSKEQAELMREEMEKEVSREGVFTDCIDRGFSTDHFDCIMKATTMNELGICDAQHFRGADPVLCAKAAEHIFEIMPAKLKKKVTVTTITEKCMEQTLSRAQFDCVMKTVDFSALDQCEQN